MKRLRILNRIFPISFFLMIISIPVTLFGTVIEGKIKDNMSKDMIEGALVLLLDPKDDTFVISAVSNQFGEFILPKIPAGKFSIEVRKDGYFSNVVFDLIVTAGQNLTVNVNLLECKDRHSDEFCFMLGGIEVKSQHKEIIPEEIETIRKIESGEIEHSQASSLGDVLSLIPGIEKNNVPGLSEENYVGIRAINVGGDTQVDDWDSFGTAIIVDGTEISTNANASQQGDEVGRWGIDLRTIPADNIKSVEVITGISSVEYSNFSNGVINVETKDSFRASKLKAKMNPDTKTLSYGGGHKIGNSILTYHLNYAHSERNLRIKGDEYQRYNLNVKYSQKLLNDKLHLRPQFTYTKRVDSEEPSGFRNRVDYDKGYRSSAKLRLDYRHSADDKLEAIFNVNLDNKKVHKEKWIDDQIITETDTIIGYQGVLNEIGMEWNLGAKIQRKVTRQGKHSKHNILYGLETDYDTNVGEGLKLDSQLNYYGAYSARRSYSFDDFPGIIKWSIYIEDKITSRVFKRKAELMIGLRYDVFNPQEFDLEINKNDLTIMKSQHGDFLSPRLNARLFLTEDFRIRLGVGRSVKSISLGQVYRADAYYKGADGVEEIYPQQNLDLQAYTTDKYEVSLDWKITPVVGISLTGYRSKSNGIASTNSYPWGYDINPDTLTSAKYSIFQNCRWKEANGVEFTLRTKRINNLQYHMNATYRFSHSGKDINNYDSSPDTSWEDIWYQTASKWREKVIIDHKLTYISQRLGVWLTVEAQHIPLEHKRNIYYSNWHYRDVEGDYAGTYVFYQGMSYWYEKEFYDYDSRWLLNLRLSKSMFRNTELSLYINNILDNRGAWVNPFDGDTEYFNPPIYYGLEMCTQW